MFVECSIRQWANVSQPTMLSFILCRHVCACGCAIAMWVMFFVVVTFIFRFICSALFTYLSILLIAYTYTYMLFIYHFTIFYILYNMHIIFFMCFRISNSDSEYCINLVALCSLQSCNHGIMESWKMFYVNYHAKSKCFAIVIIFWLFRREKRIEIRHSCDGDYTNNTKCHPSCQLRRDQKLNEATNYTEHWTSVHLFVFCYKIKLNKHFVFHICYALCLMSDVPCLIHICVWAHIVML